MVAPLIALALAASGSPADRPAPAVLAASQPRPKPRKLPKRIRLESKPVLRLRTLPNARYTK
jgi:hypothetical protein